MIGVLVVVDNRGSRTCSRDIDFEIKPVEMVSVSVLVVFAVIFVMIIVGKGR